MRLSILLPVSDQPSQPGTIAAESPALTERQAGSRRGIVAATLPLAAAIGVFGAIYGAAGVAQLGPWATIAMSLIVFSGALQFATIALLASGAGPLAILLTAVALNARHVVLGALLRPHVDVGRAERAGLAWFLIDESFGLAYAARHRATLTLLVAGVVCYLAWQAGTLVGVLGAQLGGLEAAASAIFPVLFIGLAAVTSTRLGLAARAVVAAAAVAGVSLVLPELRPLAPVLAAVLVALPGGAR